MHNSIFSSRITFLVAVAISTNLHAENNSAIKQTDDGFLNNETSPALDDYKVDSKIHFFFDKREDLILGPNTVDISASSYERIIKLQLSSGDIEFDSLLINDEELLKSDSPEENSSGRVKVSQSKYFFRTSSKLFPYEFKIVDFEDTNNNQEQRLIINITSLPSDAKRRIAISIPDIKNFYGGAEAPASTVGGSTRSSGGGIPAGNTNITETGSTYN